MSHYTNKNIKEYKDNIERIKELPIKKLLKDEEIREIIINDMEIGKIFVEKRMWRQASDAFSSAEIKFLKYMADK